MDLEQLRAQYEKLSRKLECAEPDDLRGRAIVQFLTLLIRRENHTITALRGYVDSAFDSGVAHAELDVHVRLGGGFPFRADELQVPEDPSLDDLIGVAERSDEQLAQLTERIQIYTAAQGLRQALAAIEAIVRERRSRLASAVREVDEGM
ncbi:hypothetical protein DB30_04712 [Enhygromyxa salina]|uniref:Uncharacterized protein n=1 Tax=Enhygromyxa salina TaxID=215803 RepID=A0A0C2D8G6_9BACT|nr:hypothetical protein DB30_04712 [Enhygromyxa salina]